jgi:ribosomal protein S6--L-glutamate ligase
MVKRLFVVVSQRENYYSLLAGRTLNNGETIEVEQAPWRDLEVASYSDSGAVVHLQPNQDPFPNTNQANYRTFQPNFVLFRSYPLGNHEHDWRLKLYGFYHADVPSINSVDSFIWSVEKSSLYAKLRRVQKKYPDFPLIPQTYYSAPRVGGFPPDFPTVIKVGSSSQGVGKAKITSTDQWTDTLSLLMMVPEYFTTEPFLDWNYDVRVQKIGSHYRAIQRSRTGERIAWKANEPIGIKEEDVPVKDTWKHWVDVAALELDMDMCGMDIIGNDKCEYVLEINSSSIGFPPRHRAEDTGYIVELLLQKMNQLFCPDAVPGIPAVVPEKKEKEKGKKKKSKEKSKKPK